VSSIQKQNRVPEWLNKLETIVKESRCRSEVVAKLGLTTDGSGNHRIVEKWIRKQKLDTSHFNYRQVLSEKLKNRKWVIYNPSEFLVENWLGSMSPIKSWAKKNLTYQCKLCKNEGTHLGAPLSLQLDHVNGNPRDNQIHNLRWLCPNCHSQCSTYGGKSLFLKRKRASEINPNWNHDPRPHLRKVIRPSKEVLEIEVNSYTVESLGRKYGVSGNAIRKWCKSYGISILKQTQTRRGAWARAGLQNQQREGSNPPPPANLWDGSS
jgi:hypothetical protein